jgi:hypothetical protein
MYCVYFKQITFRNISNLDVMDTANFYNIPYNHSGHIYRVQIYMGVDFAYFYDFSTGFCSYGLLFSVFHFICIVLVS